MDEKERLNRLEGEKNRVRKRETVERETTDEREKEEDMSGETNRK